MSLAALPAPKPETVAERVRRLQREARALACDHVHTLASAMLELSDMAAEIADGGEAYPAGIREQARQLAADLEGRANTITAIQARTKP